MRSLALLLILFVAGCTTPIVKADVTRFHVMSAAPPRSFTIVPEPGQAGSLEFQNYAEMVAAGLAAQGWRPVAPGGGEADTVVSVRWGVGQPNTVTWNSPSSVYGGYGWGGGGRSFHGAGMGFPFGDPFPYWETRSATYFPKWLAVEIADARARKAGDRRILFEGRAISEGARRELAPVMPYLVRALFTGFPGANGTTVRVELPVDGG